MDQLLGHLSQDSSVTYSEKVITLTPSASSSSTPAANGAGTKASPTGPRKSVKGGFVPEGAYPLDGERTVEKAREHYERCTRESLVKIHQAKFPTESVSRHVKPDLIADILQRITLPMWSKSELVAEATKYDVKIGARTTKDQLALGIVAHLRARGLINAKARGVSASSSSSSSSTASPGPALAPAPAPMATQPSAPALTTLTGPTPTAQPLFTTPLELAPASTTSSSSSPSLSSSPLASSARSLVKEERSAKRKEKDSSQEKEKEKRARKKTKNTEPPVQAIATEELLGAGRTSSQPSFSIDVVSLVDQVKRYGSAPPVATDPANLEPERVMRLQTLHLIDLLLNVGATSPNDMAFLAGQLKPHVQREKAALASGPQWVDAHKRTLEKRQLKRKRDKAQRKLEQAQAAMAECNQQLASLRDA